MFSLRDDDLADDGRRRPPVPRRTAAVPPVCPARRGPVTGTGWEAETLSGPACGSGETGIGSNAGSSVLPGRRRGGGDGRDNRLPLDGTERRRLHAYKPQGKANLRGRRDAQDFSFRPHRLRPEKSFLPLYTNIVFCNSRNHRLRLAHDPITPQHRIDNGFRGTVSTIYTLDGI